MAAILWELAEIRVLLTPREPVTGMKPEFTTGGAISMPNKRSYSRKDTA